jgi:hypothetical protein
MRLEDKKHKELNGAGRSGDVISVDVMDQGLLSGVLPQLPPVADKSQPVQVTETEEKPLSENGVSVWRRGAFRGGAARVWRVACLCARGKRGPRCEERIGWSEVQGPRCSVLGVWPSALGARCLV